MDQRDAHDIESDAMAELDMDGSTNSERSSDGAIRAPLLSRSRINTTSQIAIVGANTCAIESLDYEYALT
ncbi:unnamed protein product [Thlaspi arvense]|uniref:Uncharacterized protein n=1 Tax=Thlaspi arvense TaxID=13288 RepID=A0AAU9RL87_THLAR|nr:unnamed protein product [Thlaspi arvense]